MIVLSIAVGVMFLMGFLLLMATGVGLGGGDVGEVAPVFLFGHYLAWLMIYGACQCVSHLQAIWPAQ